MKAFIKKLLTSGYGLTDYVPVGINAIHERSFLQIGAGPTIEVTAQQFTLAYNPLVVGIVMAPELYAVLLKERGVIRLYFTDADRANKISEVYLKYYKVPEQWDMQQNVLVLFHGRRAHNYQLDWFRRNVILWLRYWKNRRAKRYFGSLPFALHKQYTAQFSFPRKVVLAVVKNDDFCSLFPIDLQGALQDNNVYVWGIRHSNKAIPHLIGTKKIVIADIPYTSYNAIYSLGNFKDIKNEATHLTPTMMSQMWQYPLPEYVLGYKEVALQHFEDIGSQCFFWGKIEYEERVKEGSVLHHVHMLRFLQLQRTKKNMYFTHHH